MAIQFGRKRDRYHKMPLKVKIMFLRRVLEQGEQIKKVAGEYRINYSTAKTLIRNQKIQKGKLLGIKIETQSSNKGLQMIQNTKNISGYKQIQFKRLIDSSGKAVKNFSKIQIISRIEFPDEDSL